MVATNKRRSNSSFTSLLNIEMNIENNIDDFLFDGSRNNNEMTTADVDSDKQQLQQHKNFRMTLNTNDIYNINKNDQFDSKTIRGSTQNSHTDPMTNNIPMKSIKLPNPGRNVVPTAVPNEQCAMPCRFLSLQELSSFNNKVNTLSQDDLRNYICNVVFIMQHQKEKQQYQIFINCLLSKLLNQHAAITQKRWCSNMNITVANESESYENKIMILETMIEFSLTNADPSGFIKPDGIHGHSTIHILLSCMPYAVDWIDIMLLSNLECATMLDHRGNTPLHIAIQNSYRICNKDSSKMNNYFEVIKYLCIINPRALQQRNMNGLTPYEIISLNQTAYPFPKTIAYYIFDKMNAEMSDSANDDRLMQLE